MCFARQLVDHEESDCDRGAVLQIAFLETDRRPDGDVAQHGLVLIAHPGARSKPVGHDRDETAAGAQSAQRGLEMTNRGIVVSPSTQRAREWGIHDDERWALDITEGGVEGGAVMAGNDGVREDVGEAPAARRSSSLRCSV